MIFSAEQQQAFLLLKTLEEADDIAEEVFVAAVRLELRPSPPNRPSMRDDMKDPPEELDSPDEEDPELDPELDPESSEPVEAESLLPKMSSKIVLRSPPDVLDDETPVAVAVDDRPDEDEDEALPPKRPEINPERRPPDEALVDEEEVSPLETELVPLRNVSKSSESKPPLFEEPLELELVRLLKRSDPISTPVLSNVAKNDLCVELEPPPNSSSIKDEMELPLKREVSKLRTDAKRVRMMPLFLIAVNNEDQLID